MSKISFTTKNKIEENFLLDGAETENVYSLYQQFSKKMAEYLNFTQNLDLSPDFYSINSHSYYAEIYEEDNKLLIVSFNKKQEFSFYNGTQKIQKKDNLMNDFNITLYKNIKLKNLNKKIFTENFINIPLVSNLETKINKEFYREEAYLKKLCNKYDSQKSTILCEKNDLSKIFDNFFINEEIKMEIKPLDDLLLDDIKEILTKLVFPEYESEKTNQFNLSNFTKYINNLYLLDVLEYFNYILSDYNPINNINYRVSNNNVINKIIRKAQNIEKKNINIKTSNNTFYTKNINSKIDKNELFNEIKKELDDREHMFKIKNNNNNINNNYNHSKNNYSHLFINNKKIGKENFNIVLKFLQKGNYKMFAWYINNEETLQYGINDIIKIGTTKGNLTFYLNKNVKINKG